MCTAKCAGLAPPKRKCTCDSGVTVQRDRKSAAAAPECEPPMWDALPDLFDDYDVRVESIDSGSGCACFVPNPAAQDFHDFSDALDMAMSDDLAGVQAAMEQSDLATLTARYAYSVEELRRCALAFACLNGSKELVKYWLDSQKLNVDDRCPYYFDDVTVAATPLFIAVAAGQPAIVQELLSRGADPHLAASDGTTPFYRACEEVSSRKQTVPCTCFVCFSSHLIESTGSGRARLHASSVQ